MNARKEQANQNEVKSPTNTVGVGSLSTHPSASGQNVSPDLPIEFGRYRLLKQLGVGGMGTVYLAHDTELDRKVALKLPHFGITNSIHIERFRREARLSATLDHPNICRVHDIGEHEGRIFLTMAYIEGKSLHQVIQANGAVAPHVAAKLVRGVAKAVHFAHLQGIIHRDLKPANIMIKKSKDFVIMDFGLARRVEQEDEQITATGAVLGTPAYMAPEQLRGESELIGPSSDVYSLGIILFELVAGQRPFQGTLPQIYTQVLTADSVISSSIAKQLDPRILEICVKATESSLDKRLTSAAELASALNDFLVANESGGDSSMPAVDTASANTKVEPAIADFDFRQITRTPKQVKPAASKYFVSIVVASGLAAASLVVAFLYLLRSSTNLPASDNASVATRTAIEERDRQLPEALLKSSRVHGSTPNSTTSASSVTGENSVVESSVTEGLAASDSLVQQRSPPSEAADVEPTDAEPIVTKKAGGNEASEGYATNNKSADSIATQIDAPLAGPVTPRDAEEVVPNFDVRTWKDATGTFKTEASMVSTSSSEVTLKKADGNTVKIPRGRIAKEDQEYVAAAEMLLAIDENRRKLEPFLERLMVEPKSVIEPIAAFQKQDRDPVTALWCGVIYATEAGKAGLDQAENYHDEAILKLKAISKHFPSAHRETLTSALNNRAILALRKSKVARAIAAFREIAENQPQLPRFASHNIELLLNVSRENVHLKLSSSERRSLSELIGSTQPSNLKSLPNRFIFSTNFGTVLPPLSGKASPVASLRMQSVWPDLTCFLCEGTSVLRCLTCGGDGRVSSIASEQIGFNDKTGQRIMAGKTVQVPCRDCSGNGGFRCKNCNAGRLQLD